jgi:TatD DNase family protein
MEAFRSQITWAKKLKLPIVIHARNSFNEIFEVLDSTWEEGLTGVFHSFSGNRDDAQKALSYNFYIGINGIVTFKNNDISDLVAGIPLERILLETDAPFLSPVPYRGKRNESSYLIHIAEKISEIHNIQLAKVAEVTSKNAVNLFKI